MTAYRLLHVEDSPDDAALLVHSLAQAPFTFGTTRVETEAAYIEQIATSPPDVILCDYDLPQFSAERALTILRERGLEIPFIVISNHIDANAAVVAMQHGAADYLPKNGLGRLAKAIESAIERGNAHREKAVVQNALLESEMLRRGILDSLLSRIALIDGAGTILAVNKEWKRFEDDAIVATGQGLEPGTNYVEGLEAAIGRGDAHAADLAAGLRGVIRREVPVFSMQYGISSAHGARWFIARAVPLEGSSAATVVSHRDVSERMLGHVALDEATHRLRTLSKRMLSIQEEERRSISRVAARRYRPDPRGPEDRVVPPVDGPGGDGSSNSSPNASRPPAPRSRKCEAWQLDLRPPQPSTSSACRKRSNGSRNGKGYGDFPGIEITCKCSGLVARPSNALESTCYRIVQEALNNAALATRVPRTSRSPSNPTGCCSRSWCAMMVWDSTRRRHACACCARATWVSSAWKSARN